MDDESSTVRDLKRLAADHATARGDDLHNPKDLAIGRGSKGQHIVREIASGQDPLFALANDLAEVVMKLSDSREHRRRPL